MEHIHISISSDEQIVQQRSSKHVNNKIPFFKNFKDSLDGESLVEEWMLKILESLGLDRLDAEIYVYLSKREQRKAKNIAEDLKRCKRQTYRSLRSLQLKGLITSSIGRPAEFSAVCFEKVLNIFATTNRDIVDRIEGNREQIISLWKTEIQNDT